MNALTYTSIHQFTYLFMEMAIGNLDNQTVQDSLQSFVHDLDEHLANRDEYADVVKETITEYVLENDFNIAGAEHLMKCLQTCTEQLIGDLSPATKKFYSDLLLEASILSLLKGVSN